MKNDEYLSQGNLRKLFKETVILETKVGITFPDTI